VQQQEAARNANAEATRAVKIRVIGAGNGRFYEKVGCPGANRSGASGKLLGRSHVSGMAWSWGTRAAGSGKKSGSGGNEGKFHMLNEFVFGWKLAGDVLQLAARLAVEFIPARQKTGR